MSFPVKKETYVDADEKTYRALSYDMFKSIHDSQKVGFSQHDKRIKCLEKRKKKDSLLEAGMGLMGGLLAMLGRKSYSA